MTGCLGRQKTKISYEMVPGTWEQFAEKGFFTEKKEEAENPKPGFFTRMFQFRQQPAKVTQDRQSLVQHYGRIIF